MKFYTPQIVNRWNGNQDPTLDPRCWEQAQKEYDQEWDDVQDAYDSHYRKLADNFPASVRKFTEVAVLHDEAVIAMPRRCRDSHIEERALLGAVQGYDDGDDYTVVVANEEDGALHVLTYNLEFAPIVKSHFGEGFDPPENVPVWLYDEFDIDENGRFRHNILFSNGTELCLAFKEMHWRECRIESEG